MKKHILNINEQGCFIDDTLINEKIFQEEMSDYVIRDRETEVDNLIRWISESNNQNEKLLMIRDLKDLLDYKGEFFLSSISTNDFLFPDDKKFHIECEKILKLNKILNDKSRNIIKGIKEVLK
ncbi:MAG: hypothetical protein ACTSVV_03915 [Promethearchaeota archaeon]